MLYWALIFLVIALISGLFGFRQIAGISMQISKILFFLFLIIFVIFLIMGLSVRTVPTGAKMEKSILRVGVAGDLPGMSYANPKTKQMEGFEVDLAHEIAQQLLNDPNKIEFVRTLPDERISSLQENKVDMIISQLTITPERAALIDFSIPYYIATEALLVLKGSYIQGVNDLEGKTVAVAAGTVTLQNFQRYFPNISLVVTPTEVGGVKLLKNKTVDAMGNDNINLHLLLKYMKDSSKFDFVDIGNSFPKKPFGVGVRKGNTELVDALNKIISQLEENGAIEDLLSKYI